MQRSAQFCAHPSFRGLTIDICGIEQELQFADLCLKSQFD